MEVIKWLERKTWGGGSVLTVKAHIMDGEDCRPAGGSCAMEGHMQNTMRGINTVLLQREELLF